MWKTEEKNVSVIVEWRLDCQVNHNRGGAADVCEGPLIESKLDIRIISMAQVGLLVSRRTNWAVPSNRFGLEALHDEDERPSISQRCSVRTVSRE